MKSFSKIRIIYSVFFFFLAIFDLKAQQAQLVLQEPTDNPTQSNGWTLLRNFEPGSQLSEIERTFELRRTVSGSFNGSIIFRDDPGAALEITSMEVFKFNPGTQTSTLLSTFLPADFNPANPTQGMEFSVSYNLNTANISIASGESVLIVEHGEVTGCLDNETGNSLIDIDICNSSGTNCVSATLNRILAVSRNNSNRPLIVETGNSNSLTATPVCYWDDRELNRWIEYTNIGQLTASGIEIDFRNVQASAGNRTKVPLSNFIVSISEDAGLSWSPIASPIDMNDPFTQILDAPDGLINCITEGEDLIVQAKINLGNIEINPNHRIRMEWKEYTCCNNLDIQNTMFYETWGIIDSKYRGECSETYDLLHLDANNQPTSNTFFFGNASLGLIHSFLPPPNARLAGNLFERAFLEVENGAFVLNGLNVNLNEGVIIANVFIGEGLRFFSATTSPFIMRSRVDGLVWESFSRNNNGTAPEENWEVAFRISDFINLIDPLNTNGFDRNFNLLRAFIDNSILEFEVESYCSNQATSVVRSNISYQPGSSCSCNVLLASDELEFEVNCPGCITPGTFINSVSLNRTTLGSYDDDNDGIPSGTEPASGTSRMRRNFFTSGDEMQINLQAIFYGGDVNGFSYNDLLTQRNGDILLKSGYLETNFDNSSYQFLGAEIELVRNGAIIGSYNPNLQEGNAMLDGRFVLRVLSSDFSINNIPLDDFNPNDEFHITMNFKIAQQPALEIRNHDVNFHFFLAHDPNIHSVNNPVTGDASDMTSTSTVEERTKFWCENNAASFRYIPVFEDRVVTMEDKICDKFMNYESDIYLGRNEQTKIINAFPNEYRDFGRLDELTFDVPPGYTVESIWAFNSYGFDFREDLWPPRFLTNSEEIFFDNNNLTSPVSVNYMQISGVINHGDNIQRTQGALLQQGDEGVNTRVVVRLVPDCGSTELTNVTYGTGVRATFPFPFYSQSADIISPTEGAWVGGPADPFTFNVPNTNLTISPISTTPSIGAIDPVSGVSEFEFQFNLQNTPPLNASGNPIANNAFLQAVNLNGVTITEILDPVGNPVNIISGIYQLGAIPPNAQNFTYTIRGTFSCNSENDLGITIPLEFNYGWSCTPVALVEDVSKACFVDDFSFNVFTELVGIEAAATLNNEINPGIDLCQTYQYELNVVSSQNGQANNFSITVDLPDGLIYEPNSAALSDALLLINSGNAEPQITTGNILTWNISHTNTQVQQLLATARDDDNASVFTLTFEVNVSCDYLDESVIETEVAAISYCGSAIEDQFAVDPIMTSTNHSSFYDDISLDNLICNFTNSEISLSYTASDIVESNELVLTLPPGLNYISSTQGILSNPTVNSGTGTLIWPLNNTSPLSQTIIVSVGTTGEPDCEVVFPVFAELFGTAAVCPGQSGCVRRESLGAALSCDYGAGSGCSGLQPTRCVKKILEGVNELMLNRNSGTTAICPMVVSTPQFNGLNRSTPTSYMEFYMPLSLECNYIVPCADHDRIAGIIPSSGEFCSTPTQNDVPAGSSLSDQRYYNVVLEDIEWEGGDGMWDNNFTFRMYWLKQSSYFAYYGLPDLSTNQYLGDDDGPTNTRYYMNFFSLPNTVQTPSDFDNFYDNLTISSGAFIDKNEIGAIDPSSVEIDINFCNNSELLFSSRYIRFQYLNRNSNSVEWAYFYTNYENVPYTIKYKEKICPDPCDNFYVNANPTADGNIVKVCQEGTVELKTYTIGGSGDFTYSWSPSTGLNNASIANPIVDGSLLSGPTTYIVTVNDSSCSSVSQVIVQPSDFCKSHKVTPCAELIEEGVDDLIQLRKTAELNGNLSSVTLSPYSEYRSGCNSNGQGSLMGLYGNTNRFYKILPLPLNCNYNYSDKTDIQGTPGFGDFADNGIIGDKIVGGEQVYAVPLVDISWDDYYFGLQWFSKLGEGASGSETFNNHGINCPPDGLFYRNNTNEQYLFGWFYFFTPAPNGSGGVYSYDDAYYYENRQVKIKKSDIISVSNIRLDESNCWPSTLWPYWNDYAYSTRNIAVDIDIQGQGIVKAYIKMNTYDSKHVMWKEQLVDCSISSARVGKFDDGSIACELYPNPTSKDVQLVIKNANSEKVKIEITDMKGITVHRIEEADTKSVITLEASLSPGIYFVKISSNQDYKVFKLMKH